MMYEQDSLINLELRIITFGTVAAVLVFVMYVAAIIWASSTTHKALADAPSQIAADAPSQIVVAYDILETDVAMNYCPACGTKIESGTDITMNYCPTCGTKIGHLVFSVEG